MEALYVLIPIAIGVMIVVVIAFIYTVRSGQYDDLEGPAYRILMDDDDPRIPHQTNHVLQKNGEHSIENDKSA